MNALKKRPLWPFLTAALLGLPVLYVASFGPACWIASRNKAIQPAFQKLFWPVGWITNIGMREREAVPRHSLVIWHYANFWLPAGVELRLNADSAGRQGIGLYGAAGDWDRGDSNCPAASVPR